MSTLSVELTTDEARALVTDCTRLDALLKDVGVRGVDEPKHPRNTARRKILDALRAL